MTAEQVLKLALRRQSPPWSFSELRPIFSATTNDTISLKTIIGLVEALQVVLFVSVRELSIFTDVHSMDELKAKWDSASGLTKTTLEQISGLLQQQSVFIRYISPDRRILGLSARVDQLAQVPGIHITDRNIDGMRDIATGSAGGAALCLAVPAGVLTAPVTAPTAIVVAASAAAVAAGFFVGMGIAELLTDDPGTAGTPNIILGPGPPGPTTIPEVTVYGAVPPGLDAGAVPNMPPAEIGGIPEEPPPFSPGEPSPGELHQVSHLR